MVFDINLHSKFKVLEMEIICNWNTEYVIFSIQQYFSNLISGKVENHKLKLCIIYGG